jgi:lysophospholipase L1-like esterase
MGEHTVEIYKRTEASLGVDQFRGFDFGAGKLLEPPARATRRIEFLGESQIQGFGIESPTQVCATLADKHNARKSMQQLTATALGAEMVSATYSGKGLGRNNGAGDNRFFTTLYPLAVPDDDGTPWDFSRFVPDVVIVSLGGTDLSVPTANLPTEPVLTARYNAMFTQVRAKNANAIIIGMVGGQIKDSFPAGAQLRTRMRTSIDNAITQLGDAKMFRFQLPENNNGALETACQFHANETLHGQWATALTTEIRGRTGW